LATFFVVKVIVKFIGRGIYCNRAKVRRNVYKKEEIFPAPHEDMGVKTPPTS
jgi:hypothetical protein